MHNFPITEARLIALFLQSVTYGIHMLTFTICIWTLFKRTGVRRILCSWSWFYVATALFIVGTVDVLFNLCHNVSAFVNNNHSEGNAKAVFLQISSRVNIMRVNNLWLLAVSSFVADGRPTQSAWYDIVTVISDAALVCELQTD